MEINIYLLVIKTKNLCVVKHSNKPLLEATKVAGFKIDKGF